VIRPTALGWKALLFVALLWAAFFAGPYQNPFFLLLAFLASLGALNLFWSWRNATGVDGAIAPLAAVPAGASAPFAATLSAGSRRRFELRAVVDLGRGRPRAQARFDVARGRCEATGELAALPRGVHPIRAAWLESTWPLGLVAMRRQVAAPADVVVHPAPATVEGAAGGGLAGLAAAFGAAGSDQPSGVRDFRAGDELRDVHWRATARRGRPVVTEWDATIGDGLEVVLDRRADEEEFEEALSIVTALALAAREAKERLTLHTQGLARTFGAGHAPWEELLRVLALAQPLPPNGPPPPAAATTVLRLPRARASDLS